MLLTCSRCRLLIRTCCYWAVRALRTLDCHTVWHTAQSAFDLFPCYCCRCCPRCCCCCCCGYCSWQSYSDQNLSHNSQSLRVYQAINNWIKYVTLDTVWCMVCQSDKKNEQCTWFNWAKDFFQEYAVHVKLKLTETFH